MACCTNFTLVRVKNKSGLATHFDAGGNNFNLTVPPTVPLASVVSPKSGDTLIEYYDNALAFWTYDGTNWILDFYHATADRFNTNSNVSGSIINFAALPIAPVTAPANPTLGDTLHERYGNGQVFWTYNGATWTRNYAIPLGNKVTHSNQVLSTLSESALPIAPISPPANPTTNDTIIEHYGNADIYWTYNGANWVRNFYSTKCCLILNDETGNTFDPGNITSPNTPTTGTTGNTLIEKYDNATVYWTYNGGVWDYEFSKIDGASNKNTHHNETVTDVNPASLPLVPNTAPVAPIANDTLMEHYGNANIYWTYNGTSWVRDYVDYDCCTLFSDQSGSSINPAALPAAPLVAPLNPTLGTPLIERYENGTIYWQYDGTNWVYQFHSFDGTSNKHIHSDETPTAINFNSLPSAPLTLPVSPIANDTMVEHYANGEISWTYNGTTWVQDWVNADCCTLLRENGPLTFSTTTLPTAPISPPTTAAPGNTLIEHYANGTIFWEYDGTAWIRKFYLLATTSNGNLSTHSNQTATAINFNSLPTTPVVAPTGPIIRDTLIEHYANGDVYWTYNGVSWTRNWVESDCCASFVDKPGITFDPLALPGTPSTPPTNPGIGSTLIEHYDNGEVYWVYDGTNWDVVFTKSNADDVFNTHSDQSTHSLVEGILPVVPISPPTSVETGHTLHENHQNGQAFWTFDGANWVLDYVIYENHKTYEYTAAAQYNCSSPPTTPQNGNVTKHEGDRIIEHYDNGTRKSAAVIVWEWDGVTWNVIASEYQTQHFQYVDLNVDIVPLNVANGTGYLVPLMTGTTTSYINGDTLFEQYKNGHILWNYVGCAWVRKSIILDCCCFEAYVTPIISATSQDVCINTSITFTDDSIHHSDLDTVCEYASSAWDFGDGTTGTGITVSHTFTEPGLYFVKLTSTCTSGANAVQTLIVKVSEIETDLVAPTTGVTGASIPIQSGANVMGCDPTYLWTFGDGSTSTLKNPGTHTYATAGTYTIALTVTCANGCTDSISYTITITEADAVIAAFSASDSNICIVTGDTATFANNSSSTVCTIDTWLWEVSVNGGAYTTLSNALVPPVYSPTVAGTHIIRLTATCSATSETGTTTRTLVVENPVAVISLSAASITTGTAVTVSDSTTGCTINTRQWEVSVNGGAYSPISTLQLFSYMPAVDGTHTFRLTNHCANGCSSVITRVLTANNGAVPFIAANFNIVDNTLSLNNGNTTALNDISTSNCTIDSWLWEVSVEGGPYVTIGTTQNISAYTPTAAGIHTIRQTVGCTGAGITDTITKTITVTALAAAMTTSASTVTSGGTVTLTDTSVSTQCTPATRQWAVSINGGAFANISTASPFTHTTTVAGTYTYRLTVTCADGVTTSTVTEPVTATAACAGIETCYTVCAPNATFADWGQSTTWNAANEDFSNSTIRNQVIRDGLRVSPLTNIAGLGINGTITGDGTIKTTNNAVNLTTGSLVLRILDNNTNDRRAVIMTFAQNVDVSLKFDAMRLGQTAHLTGNGNFHYVPYADGTPQITSVTGDNSQNITLTTPNADATNRSGYVCGANLNQFRLEFSSTGNVGNVVNLYFTLSLKVAGAATVYKVCDVGGVLTITNVADANDHPTAIGLNWEEMAACP